MSYSVGVLVVSDSCALGTAQDTSGLNLKEILKKEEFSNIVYDIVADDVDRIKNKLIEWSDALKLSFIVTTGGTGLSPRDVTPEATKQVIHKEWPSLTNSILYESLKITKFASLSRATAGVRDNRTLILNLPGSKKGAEECLNIALPVIKHALALINDKKEEVKSDHVIIQQLDSSKHHHQCSGHHNLDEELKSKVTDQDILSKPRKSPFPMIPVSKALEIIIEHSDISQIERVHFLDSLNRICAEDIYAKDPLPPFKASIKDGFALKLSKNYKKGETVTFTVVGNSNAGDSINISLKENECVKINTGAFVPLSADAVIQIEDTISISKNENGEDTQIQVPDSTIEIEQDIRPIGSDIESNELVLRKDSIINAAQIGIMATVGTLYINVYKQPKVTIVSTGNELLSPETDILLPGKIRDSNKSLLYSACKQLGLENVIDGGIANDNSDSVLKTFKKALENDSDVIISTGGVSMGDKDLVKDVLVKDLNCVLHFARMNMKPGKPTCFATCIYNGRKRLLFCLPGNPVSAIVTFNLVVVPSINKINGYENPHHKRIKVQLGFDAELDILRPEYHRGLLKWDTEDPNSMIPVAYSTGNQHSSRLLSMNKANCLLELPSCSEDRKVLKKGEIVTALWIEKI